MAYGLPKADVGLKAPAITELLPNPDGTGTDKTDEFIELYNPNAKPFDLSGFSLQTGITRKHTYVFPKGSSLPPKSFKAFYSKTTALSLSNTTGQTRLLAPSGNSVSDAAEYEKAKDGIAWALAKGKWYWTTKPTPGKLERYPRPRCQKRLAEQGRQRQNGRLYRHFRYNLWCHGTRRRNHTHTYAYACSDCGARATIRGI